MSRLYNGGRRSGRIGWSAVALVSAALATGCAGSNGQADGPGGPALERRDVELKHEDCDLESSSAKATDVNSDGRPDLIRVFSGDREICRAVDINMDTIVDVFIYYDDSGRQRRRESGFDRDNTPDEIAYYEAGVVVLKERETNNDAKIDTWSYYQGGKLVREERDSTGDGYVDQWWSYASPDCAKVVTDGDGDGKPDPDSEIEICEPGSKKPKAPASEPEPEEPAEGDGDGTGDKAPAAGEETYDETSGEPPGPEGTSPKGEEAAR